MSERSKRALYLVLVVTARWTVPRTCRGGADRPVNKRHSVIGSKQHVVVCTRSPVVSASYDIYGTFNDCDKNILVDNEKHEHK